MAKIKIISKTKPLFVEFSQKEHSDLKKKIRGDTFLRGIHSSMFFRSDWQDLTMKICAEFFGTHSRIWKWKINFKKELADY